MTKNNKKTESPAKEVNNAPVKRTESARDVIIRVWRVIIASDIAFAIVVICLSSLALPFKVLLVPAGIHAAYLLIKR